MNDAVFGKTMENIRKHREIKLVTNEKAYLKKVMKPNFKSGIFFSENLMGCEMAKTKVIMNKPVYLGQAILDLSKLVMYEFHYDYTKPKYGENLSYVTLFFHKGSVTLQFFKTLLIPSNSSIKLFHRIVPSCIVVNVLHSVQFLKLPCSVVHYYYGFGHLQDQKKKMPNQKSI